MGAKQKRLDSFFTRNVVRRGEEQTTTNMDNQASSKDNNPSSSLVPVPQQPPEDSTTLPSSTAKNIPPSSTIENPSFSSIEHDPGLRRPIWKYAANMRDEIRRAYLRSGPHQLVLSNGLPYKETQDILSAITMVSHTKKLIESLRDNEWGSFLDDVIAFCKKHDIDIPDFNSPYFEGRSNRKGGHVTTEHHYHFDIFNETINFQLQEIDSRFNERVVEILELSAGFNPKEGYKHFNSDSICKLARKYYFLDFTEQEIDVLKFQLKHFEAYVKGHPDLGKLSSIAEVCQGLAETGKASHYYLVDRLIRLVLTLPVSTATTERAFSAMKIVKNRLRNKMDDDFLADNLVLYIEKDIAKIFSLDSILDDFNDVKERRVQLK